MQQPFLVFHSTYTSVMIGLCVQNTLIDFCEFDHKLSSSHLIPVLDELLQKNNCSLSHMLFLAVHVGPGPFTTVRVVVTTANGLAFATGLPLIGVNGLQGLLHECDTYDAPYKIALLNAFGNDVYCGVSSRDGSYTYSLQSKAHLSDFLSNLLQDASDKRVVFCGNGIELCKDILENHLYKQDFSCAVVHQTPSLATIGKLAWQTYSVSEPTCGQLEPLYLKNVTVYP